MKKTVLFLIVFLLTSAVCAAETSEWKDRQYNFSGVKTIVFAAPQVANDVQDQFARQKVFDYLRDAVLNKSIKFITLDEVMTKIGKDNGVDVVALRTKDPRAYQKLFIDNIANYCDALLSISVTSMGHGKIRREASVSTWTTTGTDTYTINGSMYNVTGPTRSWGIIPAHDVTIVHGGVSMSLLSPITGNVIWGMTDVRDRTNKKLSRTTPDGMMKRIVLDGVEKIMKLASSEE